MKSASASGEILTKCLIRKEFFSKYEIEFRKKTGSQISQGNLGPPLIEFCLPIAELKQIVNGIAHSQLSLEYPFGDNYLKIEIPEEEGYQDYKVETSTSLTLETFNFDHTLINDSQSKSNQVSVSLLCKVSFFKKALNEFSFLPGTSAIELKFSETYP